MKNFLIIFCLIPSFTHAQSNLEADLVGTWSVVSVEKMVMPPGADPLKAEEARQVLLGMRIEFRDDHHFRLETPRSEFNIDDGYWLVRGDMIQVGHWEQQGKTTGLFDARVQQRDGSWFFITEAGEIEMRKD